MTCFRCLNKVHMVKECQMPEHKLEGVRQRNLAKMLAAEAQPGAAVQSAQEEDVGPAAYLAKLEQMQQAFENLNAEASDFQ